MIIKFFGIAAEKTGQKEITLGDTGITVAALRMQLNEKYPSLKHVNYKIAVDEQLATEETTVANAQEIAILPPFAGG